MTAIAKNRDVPRVQSSSHRVVIFDDSLWDVTFDRANESTVSAYYPTLAECFKSVPLGSVLLQKKKRRVFKQYDEKMINCLPRIKYLGKI